MLNRSLGSANENIVLGYMFFDIFQPFTGTMISLKCFWDYFAGLTGRSLGLKVYIRAPGLA